MKAVFEKLKNAEWDKSLYCPRDKVTETFGHNPAYLLDTHGLTKGNLIRLERLGLAMRAMYEVRHPRADFWDKLDAALAEQYAKNPPTDESPCPTVPRRHGTYRVRWLLFRPETTGIGSNTDQTVQS